MIYAYVYTCALLRVALLSSCVYYRTLRNIVLYLLQLHK